MVLKGDYCTFFSTRKKIIHQVSLGTFFRDWTSKSKGESKKGEKSFSVDFWVAYTLVFQASSSWQCFSQTTWAPCGPWWWNLWAVLFTHPRGMKHLHWYTVSVNNYLLSYLKIIPKKITVPCWDGFFFSSWNSHYLKWVGEDIFKGQRLFSSSPLFLFRTVSGIRQLYVEMLTAASEVLVRTTCSGPLRWFRDGPVLPHTPTPSMGFLCGFCLTFSFLLPQLSSPEMWLGGCDFLGPEDPTCFSTFAYTAPWGASLCVRAGGVLFLTLCVSPFFVWWCLQNNKYFCFWTMINLKEICVGYIS